MANEDLIKLEDLQQKFVDDVIEGSGINRETYLEYRDKGKEISKTDAEKLSEYFKVPESFFLKLPSLVHHGKDNSFGPIYRNVNCYFAKSVSEDVVKDILKS